MRFFLDDENIAPSSFLFQESSEERSCPTKKKRRCTMTPPKINGQDISWGTTGVNRNGGESSIFSSLTTETSISASPHHLFAPSSTTTKGDSHSTTAMVPTFGAFGQPSSSYKKNSQAFVTAAFPVPTQKFDATASKATVSSPLFVFGSQPSDDANKDQVRFLTSSTTQQLKETTASTADLYQSTSAAIVPFQPTSSPMKFSSPPTFRVNLKKVGQKSCSQRRSFTGREIRRQHSNLLPDKCSRVIAATEPRKRCAHSPTFRFGGDDFGKENLEELFQESLLKSKTSSNDDKQKNIRLLPCPPKAGFEIMDTPPNSPAINKGKDENKNRMPIRMPTRDSPYPRKRRRNSRGKSGVDVRQQLAITQKRLERSEKEQKKLGVLVILQKTCIKGKERELQKSREELVVKQKSVHELEVIVKDQEAIIQKMKASAVMSTRKSDDPSETDSIRKKISTTHRKRQPKASSGCAPPVRYSRRLASKKRVLS